MIGVYKDDYSYADTRLNGTVVRWNNKAFYVLSVHHGGTVAGKLLENIENDGGYLEVHASELDVSSPPLGFVNCRGHACYIMRVPRRDDWRQGLRQRSLKSLTGISMPSVSMCSLAQAIENNYPTFDEALAKSLHCDNVAWHRHWAVGNGRIYYRTMGSVGDVIDGGATLDMECDFLQGELEDAL
jgi:hypothetical protein